MKIYVKYETRKIMEESQFLEVLNIFKQKLTFEEKEKEIEDRSLDLRQLNGEQIKVLLSSFGLYDEMFKMFKVLVDVGFSNENNKILSSEELINLVSRKVISLEDYLKFGGNIKEIFQYHSLNKYYSLKKEEVDKICQEALNENFDVDITNLFCFWMKIIGDRGEPNLEMFIEMDQRFKFVESSNLDLNTVRYFGIESPAELIIGRIIGRIHQQEIYKEIVSYLLENYSDINYSNLLSESVCYGNLDMVEKFLEYPCELDATTKIYENVDLSENILNLLFEKLASSDLCDYMISFLRSGYLGCSLVTITLIYEHMLPYYPMEEILRRIKEHK